MKILGKTKEEIKEILGKLGIKEEDKPYFPTGIKLDQPFIKVPGVGFVTERRICIDDIVIEAAERVLDLAKYEKGSELSNIDWYHSMILAEKLNVQILSNRDYWACVNWALKNNKNLAESLKENAWTSSVIIWHNNTELKKGLLESHNYNGELPVVIDNPIVTLSGLGEYSLEGGELFIPERAPFWERGCFRFNYEDLDESTRLPFNTREDGKFMYEQYFVNINNLNPIACGFSKSGGFSSYTIFADWHLRTNSSVGFFAKISE